MENGQFNFLLILKSYTTLQIKKYYGIDLIMRNNAEFDFIESEGNPIKPDAGLEGRTRLMVEANRNIRMHQNRAEFFDPREKRWYPCVTRHIRNFNQRLYSAGSAKSREIIKLDPSSPLLGEKYNNLLLRISQHEPKPLSIEQILRYVAKTTRGCFPSADDPLLYQGQVVGLDTLIANGHGVCRHHTLLNCYLISRLIEEGLIKGEIIHHRQNLDTRGAHTWNIIKANGKIYSLDSLWGVIFCITDAPEAFNKCYRIPGLAAEISHRYSTASPQLQINRTPKIDPGPEFSPNPVFHCQIFAKPKKILPNDGKVGQEPLLNRQKRKLQIQKILDLKSENPVQNLKKDSDALKKEIADRVANEYRRLYAKPGFFLGSYFSLRFFNENGKPDFHEIIRHESGYTPRIRFFCLKPNGFKTHTIVEALSKNKNYSSLIAAERKLIALKA